MKEKLILAFIGFSFLLHLFGFFVFSPQVQAQKDPQVYGWLNLFEAEELFFAAETVKFPANIDFSSQGFRRKMLRVPQVKSAKGYLAADGFFPSPENLPQTLAFLISESASNRRPFKGPSCFYLWEKEAAMASVDKEPASYQAYVSSYGKVLFLYPDRMPLDSSDNLYFQEYLRQAALFRNDRFFWTKLEAVVK